MNAVDRINKKYRKRIVAEMNAIRETLIEDGFEVSEVDYWQDDTHRYSFTVNIHHEDEDRGEYNQGEHDVDVTIEIVPSPSGECKSGLNFSLDVVERGGRILGGCTPFNYSDRVWVKARNLPQVAERFNLFMSVVDSGAILCHLNELVEV